MAKINLDNVRGITTFSVEADKAYENGALVGLGDLVEAERNLYKPVEADGGNFYLITTPEIDRTSKSASIDHTNQEGSHMRVHQLEQGDIFTVEKALHAGVSVEAGQKVAVSGEAFADTDGADAVAVVLEAERIGADQRDAIAFRVL